MKRLAIRSHASKRGFTLVEMLVVAPVVILAIGAFLTVIISMTGEVLASRASNKLAYDIQDALNRIEQDIKLSTTFLAENNFDLNNGQGFDNGTTKFTNIEGASGTSIVLSMLATTDNPLSPGSSLVYLTNSPNDCSSAQLKNNSPMLINVVYFVKPDPKNNNVSTLWRRTIMPSNYAAGSSVSCSTPWQQPSCLLQANDTFSDAFCKASDVKLVEGVTATDFAVNYFTTAASTIPDAVASSDPSVTTRASALLGTPTAGVSITARQNVAGRDIERAASMRVSRLETNATSIATPATPTVPASPTITSSTVALDSVTFSWGSVNGATSYTYAHRINSGSWSADTTVSADTRTFTISSNPLDVIEARVAAVNDAGSSALATNSTAIPLQGLVGWWRFNGNTNNSVTGGGAGTITGTVTAGTGQNGQASNAYTFPAACCSYITTDTLPAIKVPLSINAWIYPTAYPSERAAIVVQPPPNATTDFYFSVSSDGSVQSYWYGTSSAGYHSSGAGTVPLNQWSMVTTTWNGAQVKLYVNGVLRNTVTTTGGSATSRTLIVGAQTSSRQYTGRMDDLRVYNGRELSTADLATLYANGAK